VKYLKIAIFISVLCSVIGINFCSRTNPLTHAEANMAGPLLSDLQVVMGLEQYCHYRSSDGPTIACFTKEKADCTPSFSSNKLNYEVFADDSLSIGILPVVANESTDISVTLDSIPCQKSAWTTFYSYYYTCNPTTSTKTFKIAVSDSSKVQNVYTLTVNRK
jgi:hypothetical protein